jgi:hypothetical protein
MQEWFSHIPMHTDMTTGIPRCCNCVGAQALPTLSGFAIATTNNNYHCQKSNLVFSEISFLTVQSPQQPMVTSCFIEGEWLSLGKKWGDVPPKVKHATTQIFTVPKYIHQQLLPSPKLSIHQFIDFPLPKPVAVVCVIPLSEFFSCYDPEPITERLLERIRRLSIPTPTVIKELVQIRHQAWLNGFKSVKYTHLSTGVTTHFPLWLISFWNEVHELRTTVRNPWIKAKAWLMTELHQNKALQCRTYVEDVNILLTELPWGINKCDVLDTEPIHTMWRYLGPHFTTGSQQNDLLEILHNHIITNPGLVQCLCVKGVALTAALKGAVATRGMDAYHTGQQFAWIRAIGDDLMKQEQALLTMAHLDDDNKHWVGIVINAQDKVIYYGDSLESPIPPDLLETYRWWISQHLTSSFDLQDLPITRQEDGSSCGILADNSLSHFAFPELFLLFKSFEVRAARMSTFARIANHILKQVSMRTY